MLEQALKQSPRLVDKNLDVLQADAAAYQAFSRRYPSASASIQEQGMREKRAVWSLCNWFW